MIDRIRGIQHFRTTFSLSRPTADAPHSIQSIAFIITRIELSSAVTGKSNLLSFEYSPHAIIGALRDLAPLAMDCEVWQTGLFVQKALAQTEYFASVGLNRWAIGAINIAMWDAWVKTLKQPVLKILCACRREVPVYGSGGWLSYSFPELVEKVSEYVRRGFRAVKIKVGSPDHEADIERLTSVRQAVGPHVKIMIDANQGLDVPSALALARCANKLDVHWFEEPIARTDIASYAHLRRHAGISLAMGEREFDNTTLRELSRPEALDLWQPDILRLGGVEGWRDSALLANSHGLQVLPHYYKEYDVPLLCTIPSAYGAESFDWGDGLVDHPIPIRNGMAYPLPGPGWGFSFQDEKLTELGVS